MPELEYYQIPPLFLVSEIDEFIIGLLMLTAAAAATGANLPVMV